MTPDEQNNNHKRDDGRRPRNRFDNKRGDNRGYRHRNDRNRKPRDDNGSGENRRQYSTSSGDRNDRPPRRDYGDRPRYSEREQNHGERRAPRNNYRDNGNRPPRRDYGDRPRGRNDYNDRRPRNSGYDRRDNEHRRYRDQEEDRPKITVPSEVTEVLHKGLDCEMNGRNDLAQILYLHGAAQLNGGCENRLLELLRKAGKDQFSTIRGRMVKECPEELIPLFDYLCHTIDSEYDISSIRTSAEKGNIVAIHCLIRIDTIDKEDSLIDIYAKEIHNNPTVICEGLKVLSRKKSSAKAAKYLEDYEKYIERKKTIRTIFTRSLKGESSAKKELNKLAALYPEAKFLEGYVFAYETGNAEDYLRKGMADHLPLILNYLQELRIPSGPFAKYLNAKKLQAKKDQWIPAMVGAVKDGSEDAMKDLAEVSHWREVRKSLESYYLEKGDVENLVLAYDERDSRCLDQYCDGNSDKILEVGKLLGGTKEIDWYARNFKKGCIECRDALISISNEWSRHCKALLYALHDSGADMEAAKVYFDMMDDPSAPSVKWLSKVCRNEEAKEYVRSRFEDMNDLETFDYVMEDDGYVPKYKTRDRRPQNRRRY